MEHDMARAKEYREEAVGVLRSWQGLEREAIETTAQIMEQTDNLLIRQVMEIIRNDSVQHHRVQQFMIDISTRGGPVTLSPEEMAEIWTRLEEHDELERKTINIAKDLKDKIKDPVQKLLLEYLIIDEQKHDHLLNQLNELKKHMSKLA
jgi:hypothetical protein